MRRTLALASSLLCGLLLAGTASAVPLTGDPSPPNPFGWMPNSTNALNFGMMVPGREGQIAPYVIFVDNGPGEVTLEFNNGGPGLAFFEIRIDGITTGTTSHPVVTDGVIADVIHTGGVGVASMAAPDQRVFSASSMVEVRLALGGERDWDFDWTSFPTAAVNAPATLALAALGLVAVGSSRRRIRPVR